MLEGLDQLVRVLLDPGNVAYPAGLEERVSPILVGEFLLQLAAAGKVNCAFPVTV